jgi:hypothetical protein
VPGTFQHLFYPAQRGGADYLPPPARDRLEDIAPSRCCGASASSWAPLTAAPWRPRSTRGDRRAGGPELAWQTCASAPAELHRAPSSSLAECMTPSPE